MNDVPFLVMDTNVILNKFSDNLTHAGNALKIIEAVQSKKLNGLIPTIVAYEIYYNLCDPSFTLTRDEAIELLKKYAETGFKVGHLLTKENILDAGNIFFDYNSKIAMDVLGLSYRRLPRGRERRAEYTKQALSSIDALVIAISLKLKSSILCSSDGSMLRATNQIERDKALKPEEVVTKFLGRDKTHS